MKEKTESIIFPATTGIWGTITHFTLGGHIMKIAEVDTRNFGEREKL